MRNIFIDRSTIVCPYCNKSKIASFNETFTSIGSNGEILSDDERLFYGIYSCAECKNKFKLKWDYKNEYVYEKIITELITNISVEQRLKSFIDCCIIKLDEMFPNDNQVYLYNGYGLSFIQLKDHKLFLFVDYDLYTLMSKRFNDILIADMVNTALEKHFNVRGYSTKIDASQVNYRTMPIECVKKSNDRMLKKN